MLVHKNEYLVRPNEDETAQIYRVVTADEEVFCAGKSVYDEKTECISTSYEDVEFYSNNESIGSLKEYGFEKLEWKKEE